MTISPYPPLPVAERHADEVYADFRRDEDVPPETPMTAEEFERFEAWINEMYDAQGLDEYEVIQREAADDLPRMPKPLTSPCGDDDESIPF